VILIWRSGGIRGCAVSDIKFLLRVPVDWDGNEAEAIAGKVSLNVVIVRILARGQGWQWIQ